MVDVFLVVRLKWLLLSQIPEVTVDPIINEEAKSLLYLICKYNPMYFGG